MLFLICGVELAQDKWTIFRALECDVGCSYNVMIISRIRPIGPVGKIAL